MSNSQACPDDRIAKFNDLVDGLGQILRRMLLKRGVPANDVDDVAQEVLMAAYQRLERYQGIHGASLKTWILSFINKTALQYYKKKGQLAKNIKRYCDEQMTELLTEQNVSLNSLIADRYEVIFVALEQLSASQRETLKLRFEDEMSYEQIAEIHQVPVGTVRSRISRGINRLRDILNKNSLDGTGKNGASGSLTQFDQETIRNAPNQ